MKTLLTLAYEPNLTHIFLMALEIKLERGLYLHDEGYDTESNYNLPQSLKKTTHIYVVTAAAKMFFNSMGYQEFRMHALMSTPKGRSAKPLLN